MAWLHQYSSKLSEIVAPLHWNPVSVPAFLATLRGSTHRLSIPRPLAAGLRKAVQQGFSPGQQCSSPLQKQLSPFFAQLFQPPILSSLNSLPQPGGLNGLPLGSTPGLCRRLHTTPPYPRVESLQKTRLWCPLCFLSERHFSPYKITCSSAVCLFIDAWKEYFIASFYLLKENFDPYRNQ